MAGSKRLKKERRAAKENARGGERGSKLMKKTNKTTRNMIVQIGYPQTIFSVTLGFTLLKKTIKMVRRVY